MNGRVSRHHSQLMECFKDEEHLKELNAKKERDNPYWLTLWSSDDGDFSHCNDNTSGKWEEKVSLIEVVQLACDLCDIIYGNYHAIWEDV